MLASTTTLLVDTKEFITGKVIGCKADGSTTSFKLDVVKTVSEDEGVKGIDEPKNRVIDEFEHPL